MIDSLTQIQSFRAYEQALSLCKSPKLFLLDIKAFKHINLIHGDEAGNAVLYAFAQRLNAFAHAQEMQLFRYKNDQFILLLDAPFELSRMEKTIFALCDALKSIECSYEGTPIEVDVHIGISFDHFNPLEKATKCLLVAKAENQLFVTYSEFANTLASQSEEKIEALIREAIRENQILVHFQAIVDRHTRVVYYESLIRLDCQHGLQSPKLFLKVARERGVYDLLLECVSHKILTLSHTQPIPIALNLSSTDLLDASRVHFLLTTFAHTHVLFEIQYDDMSHIEPLCPFLDQCQEAGIRIALDNVEDAKLVDACEEGKIAFVKIHGDIVRNLTHDSAVLDKCQALLNGTRAKNIQSIATHLNAKSALAAVQALGFELFQGYAFEQPHPLS